MYEPADFVNQGLKYPNTADTLTHLIWIARSFGGCVSKTLTCWSWVKIPLDIKYYFFQAGKTN